MSIYLYLFNWGKKHFYKTSRQFYFYFLFSLSIMNVDDNEIIAVAKEIGFMKPLKDCQIECLRYVIKKTGLNGNFANRLRQKLDLSDGTIYVDKTIPTTTICLFSSDSAQ